MGRIGARPGDRQPSSAGSPRRRAEDSRPGGRGAHHRASASGAKPRGRGADPLGYGDAAGSLGGSGCFRDAECGGCWRRLGAHVAGQRSSVRSGRLLDLGDSQRAGRVAVLGPSAALRLGIRDVASLPAIGIGDDTHLVVGILEDIARRPELLGAVIIRRARPGESSAPSSRYADHRPVSSRGDRPSKTRFQRRRHNTPGAALRAACSPEGGSRPAIRIAITFVT